jgi:hypothetical protein
MSNSNSNFTNNSKSDSKSNNKDKATTSTNLQLTDHLIAAIHDEKLIIGKSNAGDWLALLDNNQLIGLMTHTEHFIRNDIDLNSDLLGVMINLLTLETGPVDKLEILQSEFFERFNLLFILCQFDKLSRDGFISNVIALNSISGLINRPFSYDLTPIGILEARKPNANPILVSRLNAMNSTDATKGVNDSASSLTKECKIILMRIGLNYCTLLSNKDFLKANALLKWAQQNHDPLALEAINLINTFFVDQLHHSNINYHSLPYDKRLSFFLDNPHYLEQFFSNQIAGSLIDLMPKDETLPQKIDDLYNQENNLLFNQYLVGIEHSSNTQHHNKNSHSKNNNKNNNPSNS